MKMIIVIIFDYIADDYTDFYPHVNHVYAKKNAMAR